MALLTSFLPTPFPFHKFPDLLPMERGYLFCLICKSAFEIIITVTIILHIHTCQKLLRRKGIIHIITVILYFKLNAAGFIIRKHPWNHIHNDQLCIKSRKIFLQDLHNFLYLFLRIVSYKRNSYRIPFCIQICNID